jgi:plasmid stability protein
MPVALQIRNVPDDLHRKLKERAARAGMSLSEYLLSEVRQSAEQLTIEEMLDRLRSRTPVNLSESPADAIRAERDSR